MLYVILAVVLIIFIALFIRNKKGGNFKLIARNVAGIYEAVDSCPSSSTLTEKQKFFLTALLDMMAYVKNGQISLESIENIADLVVSDSISSDIQGQISLLASLVMRKIFSIDSRMSMSSITQAVTQSYGVISDAVSAEMSLGINGALCKKWLPIAEAYITEDNDYSNYLRAIR